jgi:hypothetical protein
MHAFAISLAFTMSMEANLEGQLLAFPPREVVGRQFGFLSDFATFLKREMAAIPNWTDSWRWHANHFQYLLWSHGFWYQLRKAQDKTMPLDERVEALSKLKEELLTTKGIMPPIVCYRRFHEGPPPPNPDGH